jgi:hypothetical protein
MLGQRLVSLRARMACIMAATLPQSPRYGSEWAEASIDGPIEGADVKQSCLVVETC